MSMPELERLQRRVAKIEAELAKLTAREAEQVNACLHAAARVLAARRRLKALARARDRGVEAVAVLVRRVRKEEKQRAAESANAATHEAGPAV